MLKFLYYYLRSMRLYYGFVTATTVLAGLCLAHAHSTEGLESLTRLDGLMFVFGFLAWGANQIFSDWCDRKEDAINAPHRPMVTGALAPRPAFALSALILSLIAIVSAWVSPWTLLFLLVGGALNIAYSRLKRIPIVNCLVYAAAISCCALYAVAGVQDRCPGWDDFLVVAVTILPAHFLMCHNSYYKDVAGDRAAGVRTLQTMYPAIVAKTLTVSLSAIAFVISWLVAYGFGDEVGESWWRFLQPALVAMLAVAHFIFLQKRRYHVATCLNCQFCVALMHVIWFIDTWLIELVSLVAIQLLFLWYDDEKE